MAVIVKGENMPNNCQYCRHRNTCRCDDFYCHMDLGEAPRDMKDCPLKSVDGLIEKMKENCNYDNNDKLSDYSIDLDEAIDIIKNYCEVR